MQTELTAEQVYRKVRKDLAGANGAQARRSMIMSLANLQAQQKVDVLRVMSSGSVRVMNLGGAILISSR